MVLTTRVIGINAARLLSRLTVVFLFLGCLVTPAWSQSPATTLEDAFGQSVPGMKLTDEPITNGVAQLGQIGNVAVAVEYPLGNTISAPAPPLVLVTGTFGPGTLASALDALCSLDQTFAWVRIGNTVHILPRALEKDPSYLLNRKIEDLSFQDVPSAQEAVLGAVAQLSGPKQQIAVLQVGMSLSFYHPWIASFKEITVREAFDKIAQQFGPTYGWQFTGAADFKYVTFHERLGVRPKNVKQPLSQ
jgi:hypothetical protein